MYLVVATVPGTCCNKSLPQPTSDPLQWLPGDGGGAIGSLFGVYLGVYLGAYWYHGGVEYGRRRSSGRARYEGYGVNRTRI